MWQTINTNVAFLEHWWCPDKGYSEQADSREYATSRMKSGWGGKKSLLRAVGGGFRSERQAGVTVGLRLRLAWVLLFVCCSLGSGGEILA